MQKLRVPVRMRGGIGIGVVSSRPDIRVALWNVQWARPGSARGTEVRERLLACDADIICVTEGFSGLLPEGGHHILSHPDFGYATRDDRRKVLLSSRWPWEGVDVIGLPELPTGRFARGRVSTPFGEITVIGVCIPWRMAHVTTGRRDRRPWQDHETYLIGLERILSQESASGNLLVVGDFNQRFTMRQSQPEIHGQLRAALKNLNVCTAGPINGVDRPSIDHVAHSAGLVPLAVSGWNATGRTGLALSDHFGLSVDFGVSL
jgi:endonuclease/exonuclease/phosphatase family metal-dependent hydrolase